MNKILVKKYFKCFGCKELESKLIHPKRFKIKCSNCGSFLKEISYYEFNILQKKLKHKNEELEINCDPPYTPSENVLRNIYPRYETPKKKSLNEDERRIRYNINEYKRKINLSTNHYSDMNIVNDYNNNINNNFNININIFNNNNNNEVFIRILERNQIEASRRAHPPTNERILKKLKRFPLNDKYCKKDKNGKIELPSCCICLNNIKKKEETVLLPCAHMFHWICCLSWLKTNNTCPICRFDLKE